MSSVYLFSVNPDTPPVDTINSGEEVSLVVRGAFADVDDIRDIPTPFTPACDGHPLAPVSGPIYVNGAEPGDAVLIDILNMEVHEDGMTAILRDFGVLRQEFADPKILHCPVRDGKAWFADRIPLPLNPNLGDHFDHAAGGLQAVLCRRLWRRFRPEGRLRRQPYPSAGHGAGCDGVLRRPARRDQRRDHHRHRGRVHLDRHGADLARQGSQGRASDYRI